jgi:alkanesulfonate monooxygenase SsuD/methylene tetrahydromethanopterin reductase-like flavin-dependent oxidoreductase (luciferase family)
MADYGHELEFGYFLLPDHGDPSGTLRLARELDELGYDLIGIQDHPYQRAHFDALALIGVLLGQTSRARFFPDVANLPLRPPAMLAKTAASLDQVSGGRFELGLGAGAFWDAIAAMGGPVRTPPEAVAALREAVTIIRAMWSGQRGVRFAGEHYQVRGAQPGPLPAHDIGIWLGVLGPRMLRMTGALADGWVPSMAYLSPARSAASHAIIDAAARAAGREPAAIRRVYKVSGSFADAAAAPPSDDDKQIVGPVEHWVAALSGLALRYGFASFVLWTPPAPEALRLFIQEVAPAVRARVAAARSGAT